MKLFDYIETGSSNFEVAYLDRRGEYQPQSTWHTEAQANRWCYLHYLFLRFSTQRVRNQAKEVSNGD